VHQPALAIEEGQRYARRIARNIAIIPGEQDLFFNGHARFAVSNLLDKLHVPPGLRAELASVVIAGAAPFRLLGWQLIPLFAGYLAGFATDAQAGISEKAHRLLPWQGGLFAQWLEYLRYLHVFTLL
jgi:hypothetical protein